MALDTASVASSAKFLKTLFCIDDESALDSLRRRGECEGCGVKSEDLPDGARLLKCARCRHSYFCSRECQKAAWPTHKAACPTEQMQIEQVQQIVNSKMNRKRERAGSDDEEEGSSEGGMETFSLSPEAALRALQCTSYEVQAAWLLLIMLLTGGLANLITDEVLAATICEVFNLRSGAVDVVKMRELEAMLGVLGKNNSIRAEKAEKDEAMEVAMRGFRREHCASVMTALGVVLPQVELCKSNASPHTSNRDLVQYVYDKQERGEWNEIPHFLMLVDECVANLATRPLPGCPLPESTLKNLKAKLRKRIEAAWVRFGRIFEQDEDTPDVELLDEQRKRWYIQLVHKQRQACVDAGRPERDRADLPGAWIPRGSLRAGQRRAGRVAG